MSSIFLAECGNFLCGGTPSKSNEEFWSGDIPWFSPKDIKTFELRDSQDRISQTAIEASATQVVGAGAVLVVCRSGVLAHTLPVGIVRQNSAFNQDIKAILPSSSFDSEFLALFIKSNEHRIISNGVKVGATVHSLKSGFLETLRVPSLSLRDQRRIAARLKKQLAAVEEARRAAEEQVNEAKKLFPAILSQAFTKVADSKQVKIGEVATIQLGKMLSPKSKTGTSYFPYLRNQNVQWGRIDLTDIAQMDFSEAERKKFSLMKGDLLVCEGGEPGRCAIWRGERQDFFYQKAIHRIRPLSDQLVPEYLMYWLWHQAQTGAFEDQNAKTTIAHLPVVRLEQLPVPLPNSETQRAIAEQLSLQLKEITSLEKGLAYQLSDIERLPSRLLAQAFGET